MALTDAGVKAAKRKNCDYKLDDSGGLVLLSPGPAESSGAFATPTKEILAALRLLTGRGPLVFPSTRHAHLPMSENAMGYLLNRAGYHSRHVPHGWRATFSSVMNESHQLLSGLAPASYPS